MKYKKGDTITIKTHHEMIADPNVSCWYEGNHRQPSGTRTYAHENERGSLTLTNAAAKKVMGKEHKVLSVQSTSYNLDVGVLASGIKDWMIND